MNPEYIRKIEELLGEMRVAETKVLGLQHGGLGATRSFQRIDPRSQVTVQAELFDQRVDASLQRELLDVRVVLVDDEGTALALRIESLKHGNPLGIHGVGIVLVGLLQRLEKGQVVYAQRVFGVHGSGARVYPHTPRVARLIERFFTLSWPVVRDRVRRLRDTVRR